MATFNLFCYLKKLKKGISKASVMAPKFDLAPFQENLQLPPIAFLYRQDLVKIKKKSEVEIGMDQISFTFS